MSRFGFVVTPVLLAVLALPPSAAQEFTARETVQVALQAREITTPLRPVRPEELALVQTAPPAAAPSPRQPRRVAIDWDEAQADARRQNAFGNSAFTTASVVVQSFPRPTNPEAAQVSETRLPVLLPRSPALQMSAPPQVLLFPRQDFYAASIIGDGVLVEVFGTRLAHAPAPDARTARQLAAPGIGGVRISRTEGGFEANFNRYGAAYSVTVECDVPQDTRCLTEAYTRGLVDALVIAAGTPD